ncbi:hypothetical protein H2204_011009 [Knufia peltigerae]|uniref:Uncharacterized protein n=1 Tax=Knufia peltigerae TaxID=1002370 RepID=A0AA38XV47_9EURO|nr:hypothetical protein H2204_011009 [Knufia peltigerae]
MSEAWIRDSLLAMERASIEMASWKQGFLAELRSNPLRSRSDKTAIVCLHRNVAMGLYNSLLITVNVPHQMYFDISLSHLPTTVASLGKCSWERSKDAATEINDLVAELTHLGFGSMLTLIMPASIVHGCFIYTLHSLFRNTQNAPGDSYRHNACLDILNGAKDRYPALNGFVDILEAVAQHAEQEISSSCTTWEAATDPGSSSELSIDENPKVLSAKGRIMFEAVALLNESLSSGELLDVPLIAI